MKKLNKLVLQNAKTMTANQMKHITGGYGSCSGGVWCFLIWEDPNIGYAGTDGCCGGSNPNDCVSDLNRTYSSLFSGFYAECY
jgi:bacteriocin-like protein